jgi:20S proteasome subunit alpha 2
MSPDSRVLIAKARKSAQTYKRVYQENPPTAILVKEVAGVMQEFTQSGGIFKVLIKGVRPFGVSLLVAGWDENAGPMLYQVDPSGSYWAWKATALGKNMLNAKTFLEKRYSEDLQLEDAVHTAILTLKEGIEGAISENNIEIGIIEEQTRVFRILSQQEIKDYLTNIS